MSKTIDGIPEYLTRDQYLGIFTAAGVTPDQVVEMRMAHDGIHILIFALDENGRRVLASNREGGGYQKHRIFIPVRRSADDSRTTRITDVQA